MKIPGQIKIGSHVYEIVRTEQRTGCDLGSVSPWDLTIKIIDDNGAKESLRAETLLHEVIEAIKNQFNLNINHGDLTILSEILFDTIRSNKLNFKETNEE